MQNKMTTLFMILGLLGGVLVAISIFGYRYYSGKNSNGKHEEVMRTNTEILNKQDSLQNNLEGKIIDTKKAILINQDSNFNDLKENLSSIDKNIEKTQNTKPSITIENSPNTNVQINENGDNIINQKVVQFEPHLTYFEDNTMFLPNFESNLIKTRFYFGSEKGFALMNPKVDIKFDCKIESFSGGVVSSGIASSGRLQKQILEDSTRYILSTDMLQSGNNFFIETLSAKHPNITTLEITP